MNRKQFYQIMSMISMGLGFAWMKAFEFYPMRAVGFISLMISGFLFVEVLFYEEDPEPARIKDLRSRYREACNCGYIGSFGAWLFSVGIILEEEDIQ